MKRILILALLLLATTAAGAQDSTDSAAHPRVTLETTKGTIVVELFPDKAPKTVANFLAYVESGFYDGTAFHRVIPDFMVQVGGFTADLVKKPTRDPIENESKNGLLNTRGTLAMARTGDPHSATAQFFINLVDNDHLNGQGGWGYAVFGQVVEGMDVVDAIAAVPTGFKNRMPNVPVEPVLLDSAKVGAAEQE